MQKFDIKNHVPLYTWMSMTTPDEWETMKTQEKACVLPWVFHHVALMADGHQGRGPNVGSVIAMKEAISPSAVGSDIGCGMAAVQLSLKAHDLPDSLADLRTQIEEAVPVGFAAHSKSNNAGPFRAAAKHEIWNEFELLDERVHNLKSKALSQCGTLGGGNHFIELCLDAQDNVWLMLHSGSRNIGKEVAEKHIAIAKKLIHNESLEDKNFSVFLAQTPEFEKYVHNLMWCQRYALLNRQVMMGLIEFVIQEYFHPKRVDVVGSPVFCHHNYVSYENHFGEDVYVTRKGAISAKLGERGIIPGSQTSKSFIVEGLGNTDSFMSASHGAGRRMSRGDAKRKYTMADLEASANREFTIAGKVYKGVECRTDRGVLDEIEYAYKPIETVMENQADLVKIVAELKQILTIKG